MGHGPHLCFLHGFCESSQLWTDLISHLSKSYECLLIDLPGFGQSKGLNMTSISNTASMCNELLDELAWQDVQVFGHSMGGYIALEMLHQKPDIFKSIGLIHSTAYSDSSEKKLSRLKVMDFVAEHGSHAFLRQFYPALVAPEKLLELDGQIWNLVKDTEAESIIAATKAMMNRKDHSQTISSMPHPILFVCGDQDEHFPLTDILKQSAICHSAQLNLLKEVGHLSMLEAPEQLRSAVSAFLKFVEFNTQ